MIFLMIVSTSHTDTSTFHRGRVNSGRQPMGLAGEVRQERGV